MRRIGCVLVWLVLLESHRTAAYAEDPAASEKSVQQWARDLGAHDLELRRQAVYALWQQGQESGVAVVALARALQDSDAYVRTTAKKVLDRLEPVMHPDAWKQALPILVEGTRSTDVEVRRNSAIAIWKASMYAQETDLLLGAAERFLADEDSIVRANGAGILWHMWQSLAKLEVEHQQRLRAALAKQAVAADVEERLWAAKAYIGLLDTQSLVVLAPLLEDEDERVREAASYSIGIAPLDGLSADEQQTALLLRALRDASPLVRVAAASSIGGLGSPAATFVHLVGALMGDDDADVRKSAAFALASSGRIEAVGPLLEALASEHVALRTAAAMALPQLGPLAALAVPRLIALLRTDEDDAVRTCSVMALGSLGTFAKPALPALLVALKDSPPGVQPLAASALYGLALAGALDSHAASALGEAMANPSPGVQLYCAQALGALREHGAGAAQALARAYDGSEDSDVRAAIVSAWRWQGAAAQPYLDRLRVASASEDRLGVNALGALAVLTPNAEERAGALERLVAQVEASGPSAATGIYQLGLLGPLAAEVAPRLRALLKADNTPYMRFHLMITLVAIQPGLQDDVRRLQDAAALEMDEAQLQRAVCNSVGEFGPGLLGLQEIVIDSLSAKDASLRRAALRALRRLESTDPRHLELAASLLDDADRTVCLEAANAVAAMAARAP